MLEPFVFRRDDDDSFPDESKAPIRASATTSWGAAFRIALSFAEPPLVSRLYAQLPGFPDPKIHMPLAILATHRHLALLSVARGTVQDLFIYSADDPSKLQLLPSCPPLSQEEGAQRRLLAVRSMGILCRGKEEFAVAELMLLIKPSRRRTEVFADICLFKSSTGKWESMRVSIGCDDGDIWQLGQWQTDAVVPVDGWLCWVDYYRGILFCDVLTRPAPAVFFHRFPLREFPCAQSRGTTSSWLYRVVSAIDAGRALKFVDVARDDGIGYGELKPGAGFTVTCHTLQLGSVAVVLKKESTLGSSLVWQKDGTAISSDELWSANPPERLPRGVLLMFPQVDIDRPHVVHFIIREDKFVMKKMWLVAVDMNTGIVESFYQYVNGREDIGTVDADLTEQKSMCPKPFLPCDFSKYLH